MSIFEYDAEKEMKLFREAERGAGYTEGLKAGRAEGIEAGKKEGALEQLFELVEEGLLSTAVAARKAGMTEEAFIKQKEKLGR